MSDIQLLGQHSVGNLVVEMAKVILNVFYVTVNKPRFYCIKLTETILV